MEGIILVDKPKGITSRDVVNEIIKKFNTKCKSKCIILFFQTHTSLRLRASKVLYLLYCVCPFL